MKKIIALFLVIVMIQTVAVKADDLMIDYTLINGKYELKMSDGSKTISYDEAKEKFKINDYIQMAIDQKIYYFYLGKQITEEEYNVGAKLEKTKKDCDDKTNICIEVSNHDEIIKTIDDIFASRKIATFHILYDLDAYKKIDFKVVDKYFKDTYMTDLNKNAYKYSEYGIMAPIRFSPTHNEYEMIVSTTNAKTTPDEEKMVDEFLDSFLPLFEGKSDYEKVLGVYLYLSKTSRYATEDSYTNALDGRHSPYDVLLTHKTVCIGSATTFQFIMEKLGVESYIIDHVEVANKNEHYTTHVYNVVKLDNNWFIVDVTLASSGDYMLVANNGKYASKDFKYLGIKISDKSYSELHPDAPKTFEIDYDRYVKLADDILKKTANVPSDDNINEKENGNAKEDSKEDKIKIDSKYVSILAILSAVCVVIIYFTKRS